MKDTTLCITYDIRREAIIDRESSPSFNFGKSNIGCGETAGDAVGIISSSCAVFFLRDNGIFSVLLSVGFYLLGSDSPSLQF